MFDFCRHPPPEFSAFSRDMRKKMLGSNSLEPVAGLARHPRKCQKFYRSPKLKSGIWNFFTKPSLADERRTLDNAIYFHFPDIRTPDRSNGFRR